MKIIKFYLFFFFLLISANKNNFTLAKKSLGITALSCGMGFVILSIKIIEETLKSKTTLDNNKPVDAVDIITNYLDILSFSTGAITLGLGSGLLVVGWRTAKRAFRL